MEWNKLQNEDSVSALDCVVMKIVREFSGLDANKEDP
jgi:hypothetical protein